MGIFDANSWMMRAPQQSPGILGQQPVNNLGILGALLRDLGANANGQQGNALLGIEERMRQNGEQTKYQDMLKQMFGPQNINPVQSTPQMPMTGAGAELANRRYAGDYSQPTYGGAVGGLSNETQDMLAKMLPTMSPNQGMPMLFNSITSGQERADRKNDVLQQNAWQNQAADRNRQQTVQDNTIRPMSAEEKARYGFDAKTPVFTDGFGKPIVIEDPLKLTPLQQEQLKIQKAQLSLQQQQEAQDRRSQQAGAAEGYDAAIGTLEKLMTMPGFSDAVGAKNVLTGNPFGEWAIPGTDRADFNAQLETLKSQTFLPMVQQLKGMGALSNAEGEKLTTAIGALSTSQSEQAFKASAGDIWRRLTQARNRVPGVQQRQFGNSPPWESKAPTVSNW